MGKRELLLLVVFVVLGVGVYQVSAPAAPADAPGFSLSRIVQMAKSHFGGPAVRTAGDPDRHAHADRRGHDPRPRRDPRGGVVVEGSDRADIQVRLEAVLGGMDEADLARQEKACALELKSEGPTATAAVDFDDDRAAAPLRTARRDAAAAEGRRSSGRGSAEVRGIAGLATGRVPGRTHAAELTGPVTGEMRDARAEFGAGATIDLETRTGACSRRSAGVGRPAQRARRRSTWSTPPGPVTIKTGVLPDGHPGHGRPRQDHR